MYVLSMSIKSLGVTSNTPGPALTQQDLVGYPFGGPTAGRIWVTFNVVNNNFLEKDLF